MAVTKRLRVRLSSELLADGSNGGKIFLSKDVFIYAHRWTVARGDYMGTDVITVEFDGAQEILYCTFKEEVTNATEILYSAPVAITGRQGLTVTLAATNASSRAVQMFAIVRM